MELDLQTYFTQILLDSKPSLTRFNKHELNVKVKWTQEKELLMTFLTETEF